MDIPKGWTKSDRFDDFYEYKNGQMIACVREVNDEWKVDLMKYEEQEGYEVCYKVVPVCICTSRLDAISTLFAEMNKISCSEPY